MRKVLICISFLFLGFAATAQDEIGFIDAVQAYAEGNIRKAQPVFKRILEQDPQDDAAAYYLGLCEYASSDIKSAEKHLLAAIEKDSTNTWYLSALANFYNSTGRHLKTAEICEKLLKMDFKSFKSAYTLCLIGDAKLSLGLDSLAVSYYDQALEMDPEYAPAEIGRAEAMRMRGNYAAYFSSLEKFIRNEIVDAQMKSGYIEALLQGMDAQLYWAWGTQIHNLIDTCLELNPDDIQSHLNKLTGCSIKQDTLGMIQQCREVIPLAKAQKDTANLLLAITTIGDFYHEDGNNKAAYKTYEQALKINPSFAPVLNNYAYFLSQDGKKLRKALKMSKVAIEQEPDNATYLDTYGWILYLLKRPQEAKPYFKHAMIYGGKDSAVILRHYAKVLDALGDRDLSNYYYSLAGQKEK